MKKGLYHNMTFAPALALLLHLLPWLRVVSATACLHWTRQQEHNNLAAASYLNYILCYPLRCLASKQRAMVIKVRSFFSHLAELSNMKHCSCGVWMVPDFGLFGYTSHQHMGCWSHCLPSRHYKHIHMPI